MGREQSKRTVRLHLALIALILAACVILTVGVTMARYRTSSTASQLYTARKPSQVYLWSGYDDVAGQFSEMGSAWTASGSGMSLDFCVSNGTGEDSYSQTEQDVTIRLATTAGANGAVVRLAVDGELYEGTALPLQEGTPFYAEFGDGWIYHFYDAQGEEVRWPLAGGQLSILSGQMLVENWIVEDTTLVRLLVSGT